MFTSQLKTYSTYSRIGLYYDRKWFLVQLFKKYSTKRLKKGIVFNLRLLSLFVSTTIYRTTKT